MTCEEDTLLSSEDERRKWVVGNKQKAGAGQTPRKKVGARDAGRTNSISGMQVKWMIEGPACITTPSQVYYTNLSSQTHRQQQQQHKQGQVEEHKDRTVFVASDIFLAPFFFWRHHSQQIPL